PRSSRGACRARAARPAETPDRRRPDSLPAPLPARSDRHRPAPPRRGPGGALIVYAESSAILAWLFGEPGGQPAVQALDHADLVTASDLTLLECDRSLVRAGAVSMIPEERAARLR